MKFSLPRRHKNIKVYKPFIINGLFFVKLGGLQSLWSFNRILIFFILTFGFCIYSFSQEQDGFTRFYYPNGQVSSEGKMRNGKPDGFWRTYYVSGIIKSEGLRSNFELDSIWNFYDQKGELVEQISFKYGKKNGYSISYSYEKSPEGTVIAKELYVNDIKQGNAWYYHPNGVLREELTYTDGRKQGPAKEYDENGELVHLLQYHNNFLISRERVNRTDAQGRKQGVWKTFYENGNLQKEMFYKDDLLDGMYREFTQTGSLLLALRYSEGKLQDDFVAERNENNIDIDVRREFSDDGRVTFIGSYRDDVPTGIHRFFGDDGQVEDAMIYNEIGEIVSQGIIDELGTRNGPWKDLYPNGKVKSQGSYVENVRSGRWRFYYDDGSLEQEGNYLRGNLDGTWRWYHPNGQIWREEMYFNGREDGESVEYDPEGNIIARGNYINGEKEGPWIYDVGDHIEEGSYQTGLENEVWQHYYRDGTLKFIGEYRQGMPEGRHRYYYPDGSLMEERFFSRGLKERNWKKYDESGSLFITITYRRDVEVRINGERINLPSPVTRIR